MPEIPNQADHHSHHDGFLHYHRVSTSALMEMVSTILSFLSPRASKPLLPICTLTQSSSCSTIAVNEEDDPFFDEPENTCNSHCLQIGDHSNQRTRNQFRPRNATKGTTSYQLRQYAEATLGGGSLRKIVKLPEGEDENEWLAVNSEEIMQGYRRICTDCEAVVDFYNHINLLYGSITEFCSPQSCPEMKATDE